MTGPSSFTMEEIEQQLKTQEKSITPKAEDLKLEAEGLPEGIRGKSAADVANEVEKLRQALKISEDARLALRDKAESIIQAAPAAPAPEQPKDKTREELAAMYEQDPLATMEYLQDQAARRIAAHFEQRFAPFVGAQAKAAEEQARTKFKTEFELFGKDIQEFMGQVPNKEVFNQPGAWEDMITYIRGKPGNFEKLVELRTNPKKEAREREIADVGFTASTNSARRELAPTGKLVELDPVQKEICQVMNISEEDYIKYHM